VSFLGVSFNGIFDILVFMKYHTISLFYPKLKGLPDN